MRRSRYSFFPSGPGQFDALYQHVERLRKAIGPSLDRPKVIGVAHVLVLVDRPMHLAQGIAQFPLAPSATFEIARGTAMALSAIMMVQATTSSISVNPRWFFLWPALVSQCGASPSGLPPGFRP